MNREPIYEFVKGEGWVIKPTLTMRCGTEVHWDIRLPNRKEVYMQFGRDCSENYIVEQLKLNRFPTTRANQLPDYYERLSARYHIVVLHRVSDTPHDPDEVPDL